MYEPHTHAHITYMHALTLHMQTHGKHINARIQTAHTHAHTPHTHTHTHTHSVIHDSHTTFVCE